MLVNYEVVGKGKPMLILHGWKSCIADWLPFSDQFKSKYRIILVDLPGFGGSSKPNVDWGIYEYFEFTKKFIESLGLKKLAVLGHSFGGRVAILLAARTNLVEKLILVDAAGMELKSWKAILFSLMKPFVSWLPQEVKNRLGSHDYKEAGEMRKIFVKIVNQPLREELAKITTPTLIVWGEKDTILSLKEAKMLHKGIKNSVLRNVWGAGHWPHTQKPEQFAQILQEEGL